MVEKIALLLLKQFTFFVLLSAAQGIGVESSRGTRDLECIARFMRPNS